MEPNESNGKRKPERNAFAVINKVRDNCDQPDQAKRYLLLVIATYCDDDGICWPSNRALVRATRKSERTIRRTLSALVADGELEILTPGIGRGQQRILHLKEYVQNEHKALQSTATKEATTMAPLNRPRLSGKTSPNNHSELPTTGLPKPARSRVSNSDEFRELSEKGKTIVGSYNRILASRGWFPVDKITPTVMKVLPLQTVEEWRTLFIRTASEPEEKWPSSRTLVRLAYHSQKKRRNGSKPARPAIDYANITRENVL